jgi:hypothetical protein
MARHVSLEGLAEQVRRLYVHDRFQAEGEIEALLEKEFAHLPTAERLASLGKLTALFEASHGDAPCAKDEDLLARAFSLLLGRQIGRADLASSELLERLAVSPNTVFDMLNEIIRLINTTLTGQGIGEETIRQFIGVHLEGEDQTESLQVYLGQIKKAFLVTQEAFKQAARTKFGQVLKELDPQTMTEQASKGFKFGPMRKAELFESFEAKYNRIKKWFDSGRFTEEFLREFERNATKLSSY